MAKPLKSDKAKRELLEKIEGVCNQLSLLELLQIYLYINRAEWEQKWSRIVWNWLLFQLEIDKRIKTLTK